MVIYNVVSIALLVAQFTTEYYNLGSNPNPVISEKILPFI